VAATATAVVFKVAEQVAVADLDVAVTAGAQDLVVVLARAVEVAAEHLCSMLQAAVIQENPW
jgi:hypothetical protein